MSHNDYVTPDNKYPGELVLRARDFRRFDVQQFEGVDGDDGGTWNPATPIILGRAGVDLTSGADDVRGGVETKLGGRLVMKTGDQYPQLSPDRSRTISFRLLDVLMPENGSAASSRQEDLATITTPPNPIGVRLVDPVTTDFAIEVPSRYLHEGASPFSVALVWRHYPSLPASVPTPINQLYFRLEGYDYDQGLQLFAPPVGINNWSATTVYATSSYILPQNAQKTGFYYKATTGGTSGGSQPTWPIVLGNTVVDGTVTWTCFGLSGQNVIRNGVVLPPGTMNLDEYRNDGRPLVTQFTFDLSGAVVDFETYRYRIRIANATNQMLFHSVVFDYANITRLSPP